MHPMMSASKIPFLGVWAEFFFGSIRYARFGSIPVRKSIRFSGTYRARYPDFRSATRSIATYVLRPICLCVLCTRDYVETLKPLVDSRKKNTLRYTVPYIVDRTSNRLRGALAPILATVSERGSSLGTLRTEPKKREADRRYRPSAQTPNHFTTILNIAF